MGRGGAKLGKEVKGAGLLNDTDRAALAAGLSPPSLDSAEAAAAALADIPRQLAKRQALTAALKGLAAQNTDPIAVHHADGKWRAALRLFERRAVLTRLAAHRFDMDRGVLGGDLRRRDLAETDDVLDQLVTRAARRHRAQMDAVVEAAFTRQVANLGRVEDAALSRLHAAVDGERNVIGADHTDTKRGLDLTLQAVAKERAEGDDEATAKLEMEREQIRGANAEAINELRVVLDRVVDDLEQRFDASHAAYLRSTEERQREFRALAERDAALSADIGKRLARVESVSQEIAMWRKKAARYLVEAGARNAALNRERGCVQRQFYDLKAVMGKVRDGARDRIKQLAVRSRQLRRDLTMRLEQAERILKLDEWVRGQHVDDPVTDAERLNLDGAAASSVLISPSNMSVLMGRMNRAEMARQYVRQKRDWLRKENAELKQTLRAYLDNVTVPPTALDQNNCLVVVNGKHSLLDPSAVKSAPRSAVTTYKGEATPGIDGALIARRYAKQEAVRS